MNPKPTKRIWSLIETNINHLVKRLGVIIAYLVLFTAGIEAAIVLLRYFVNVGSIAMQELVIYLHAIVFLACTSIALQMNRHVRVDIFYRSYSVTRKAWIDLFGTIFLLLPTCGFIFFSSWDYVLTSWSIREQSSDAGGLPTLYLLKTLILLFVVLLALQGIAEIIRALSIIESEKND